MCIFLNSLPKKSKSQGTNKKRNIVLGLRPCPDKDGETSWYRVRLLNFSSKTSSRDFPFISRYVHQKWAVSDKGLPTLVDEIVCPVSKYVDWEGDRYDCPICKYAQQQYSTLIESNWKDADARKKNREWSRKFQGIVPVYVIDDPNYEGNNNKFRVIIFSNKAPTKKDLESSTYNKYNYYDEFVKLIEKQLLKANCFNGVNAVDCCIHVSNIRRVVNEGKENEFSWQSREIDKITFLKPEKAYDIPNITREAVDAFPFDDEYYVSATKDELKAFYDKHIKVAAISNNDIEDSDDELPVYTPQVKEERVVKTNKVNEQSILTNNINSSNTVDVKTDDIEDVVETSVNEEVDDLAAEINTLTLDGDPENLPDKNSTIDDESLDDLISGLDI